MELERVSLTWTWKIVCHVGLDDDGTGNGRKLGFRDLPPRGGVYRIRAGDRSYIGQAGNLRRRFNQYRNPQNDPAHTNRRVHDAVMEQVTSGVDVTVEVVDEAYVHLSTGARGREAVDMDLKWQRVMVEQAAESSARVNHHRALINKP